MNVSFRGQSRADPDAPTPTDPAEPSKGAEPPTGPVAPAGARHPASASADPGRLGQAVDGAPAGAGTPKGRRNPLLPAFLPFEAGAASLG